MDGIAVIDKPAGWTSHDVVARVRRLLGERRVGHTGTLDPFATGVLVVLVGRATRLAHFLSGADKEYEAVIRFGYATDTGDVTGTPRHPAGTAPVESGGAMWSDEQIEAALASLRGPIEQVPPMYSAKKVAGQKLYQLARRGQEVPRRPVSVTVYEFEAVRRDGRLLRRNEDGTCDLRARVVCSAGTYIRVLAEAVGERLGTGAHLAALRRTRAGAFRVEDATGLDQLKTMTEAGNAGEALLPPEAALSGMPFVHLTEAEERSARHGAAVRVGAERIGQWRDGEHIRMHDRHGRLIAVGAYAAAERHLRPRILLVPQGK